MKAFLTLVLDGDEWPATRSGCFTPEKKTVPNEQKARWAPEAVETFLGGREKSHAPTEIRTPDRQACSVVSRMTELIRLCSLANELPTPNYLSLAATLNRSTKRFQFYSMSATQISKSPVRIRS